MTYSVWQLLWLMAFWAKLMAYSFLKDFIKTTMDLKTNKQMNQFWLHHNAIKPSLGL